LAASIAKGVRLPQQGLHLHFFVSPVALVPCTHIHLVPAGQRVVPNMHEAFCTSEWLLAANGSTEPVSGVASAFHTRTPAKSKRP
jgi:hypothetical protein